MITVANRVKHYEKKLGPRRFLIHIHFYLPSGNYSGYIEWFQHEIKGKELKLLFLSAFYCNRRMGFFRRNLRRIFNKLN